MEIVHSVGGNSLMDVLERILDKGVVVAGDIKVNLAEVELLTIKIRLVISSVDKAKEVGIDWWSSDPFLSSRAIQTSMDRENKELRERLRLLEAKLETKAEPDLERVPEKVSRPIRKMRRPFPKP